MMKRLTNLIAAALMFSSCKNKGTVIEEKTATPKTAVEITSVHQGAVADNIELSATTLYLKRNLVTEPIPAFITNVNIHLGDHVAKGQILYELESKERRALGEQVNQLDTSLTNFGIIKVKAPATGIITTLDKQQPGDYVLEGAQLCTIAESNDLAFQLNVPFEFARYVKQGKNVKITFPDSSSERAVITTPLTAMNMAAQTQSILAKATRSLFLPENLIVKVYLSKGDAGIKQILPKSSVQSDEMMKSFWVMKLINDSTAIKVPVTTGNKNVTDVEILNPQFEPADRIIMTGSYGLPDTAFIKIKN